MASNELTDDQRTLLVRWFDGELESAEAARAEQLVADSERAASFVDTLEKLRSATRAAFETARPTDEQMPPASRLAEQAIEAPSLQELDLDNLAPLLERYHDEEVTGPERRAVEQLADQRDEVATYLEHLRLLGEATRTARQVATEQTDLSGLQASIERSIAHAEHPDDPPAYESARDQQLVHRYADGELPPDQRRLVEAWLEEESGTASRTLEEIEKLGGATQAAHRQASEGVDFASLGSDIQERIDDLDDGQIDGTDEQPTNIVSLDASRTDGGKTTAGDGVDETDTSASSGPTSWFSGYRQGLVGAAAAALLAVGAGLLFGPKLFESERVVVKEKTVVIVDSVQYSDGSSVVVDSPMQKVGARSNQASGSHDKNDKPTVIWLLDDAKDDKSDEGANENPSKTPSSEPGNSPDAGGSDDDTRPDTSRPPGKPI